MYDIDRIYSRLVKYKPKKRRYKREGRPFPAKAKKDKVLEVAATPYYDEDTDFVAVAFFTAERTLEKEARALVDKIQKLIDEVHALKKRDDKESKERLQFTRRMLLRMYSDLRQQVYAYERIREEADRYLDTVEKREAGHDYLAQAIADITLFSLLEQESIRELRKAAEEGDYEAMMLLTEIEDAAYLTLDADDVKEENEDDDKDS